jgi:hypothetical protein
LKQVLAECGTHGDRLVRRDELVEHGRGWLDGVRRHDLEVAIPVKPVYDGVTDDRATTDDKHTVLHTHVSPLLHQSR